MKNIIILEDEAVAGRRLKKVVTQLGYTVLEMFTSASALDSYLKTHNEPDLYLMDIHLSDCIVFEYLQEVALRSPIIFTTAFDKYAINAFKQNSIDYLLKPIQIKELKAALDKYNQLQFKGRGLDIDILKNLIAGNKYKSRISFKIGDKYTIVNCNDITHLFSRDKATFLHQSSSGRTFPIESSLTSITAELDPHIFFMVNRSCTINVNYIADIIRYSSNRLKIKLTGVEGDDIIVARERISGFKEWLG